MNKTDKKNKKNTDKLSVKRLISNTLFLFRETFKIDPCLVIMVCSAFILCSIGYTALDTLLFKKLVDMLMDNTVTFKSMAVLILGIAVVSFLVQLINQAVENYARCRWVLVAGKLQHDFIHKAAQIDLVCYDNKEYFDDFVIAASQAEEMMIQGVMSVAYVLGNISSIAVAAVLIFSIQPIVAIFPIVAFVINLVTRFIITKAEYDYDIEKRRLMRKADYSKRVFYQSEYAKEIKLSAIDIPLRKQFNEAIDEIEGIAKKAGVKIAVLSLINWITVFTLTSYLIIPLYLSYLVLVKLSMTLGDLSSTNNAQERIRNNLDSLNYCLVDFQRVGLFAERFRRFLDYKINIEDYKGSVSVPDNKERKNCSLEIKNMSFRYDGATENTLNDISMTIKPGEHIAIVGENGAGKTTFIKLLMRLYDVTGGSINYGDTDIRKFSTKEYRNIIGSVFQDYQIYGTSLAENILMDTRSGDNTTVVNAPATSNTTSTTTNAPATESLKKQNERLLKALDLADFSRKFSKLSGGLDTQMTREFSNEGTILSGGESQKVAISRMFAKNELSTGNMAIAILDEPSSALDPQAESILNENMKKAAGDASIIFISHRLSTTRDADRIYLFDKGKIAEQGTHDELMALNGKYAAMFEKQAHYYQE